MYRYRRKLNNHLSLNCIYLVVLATEQLMHCARSRILFKCRLFSEILRKLAAVKTDFRCGARSICENSLNVYPGIKLKFRDKISKFPLLTMITTQNKSIEIFHVLIP